MSKKLIAVASAAALALSVLVATPGMATVTAIDYQGEKTSTLGTAASPFEVLVPASNTLEYNANGTPTSTVLGIYVDDLAPGDKVTVTTTGAVKTTDELVTTALSYVNVVNVGKTSLVHTVASGEDEATLYVYTTSTTAGSFTVSVSETDSGTTSTRSETKYLKGIAGPAYNMSVVAPSTLAKDAKSTLVATVTDVFGNDTTLNNVVRITTFNYATGTVVTADATRVDAKKVSEYEWTSPSSDAIALSLKLNSDPANVVGFAKASKFVAVTVNSAGASSQVAALTAQLAESRPKATSVTKKKYNTLARKWNAAFPSQKVALKK